MNRPKPPCPRVCGNRGPRCHCECTAWAEFEKQKAVYYANVKREATGALDAAAIINKGIAKKLGGPSKAKAFGWLPQHK